MKKCKGRKEREVSVGYTHVAVEEWIEADSSINSGGNESSAVLKILEGVCNN